MILLAFWSYVEAEILDRTEDYTGKFLKGQPSGKISQRVNEQDYCFKYI
jgi:hypothetical protein